MVLSHLLSPYASSKDDGQYGAYYRKEAKQQEKVSVPQTFRGIAIEKMTGDGSGKIGSLKPHALLAKPCSSI